MEPNKPKSTPVGPSQMNTAQSAGGDEHHVRTYVSDLAQLIAENKLSAKELSKLDPSIIAAVKMYQVQGSGIAKPKGYTGMQFVKPEVFVKNIAVPGGSPVAKETVFDMNKAETTVSHEQVKQTVLKAEAQTPIAKAVPQGQAVPVPALVKPTPVKEVPKVANTGPFITPPVAPVKPVSTAQPIVPKPQPVSVPPISIKKEPTLEEKLKTEEQDLERKVQVLKTEEAKIDTEKAMVLKDKATIAAKSEPLKMREQSLEEQESEIERMEQSVSTVGEKRDLRKKRWDLEDERQRVERERWDIDQKIAEVEKQVAALDAKKSEAITKESSLAQALAKVQGQERALKAIADKALLMKKLTEIKTSRTTLETTWRGLMAQMQILKEKDTGIVEKEKVLEADIAAIEQKEHQAKDSSEEHKFEMERWQKDVELRKLEEQEWDLDDEELKVQKQIDDIEKKSQEVLHSEKDMRDQIAALEVLIRGGK